MRRSTSGGVVMRAARIPKSSALYEFRMRADLPMVVR